MYNVISKISLKVSINSGDYIPIIDALYEHALREKNI